MHMSDIVQLNTRQYVIEVLIITLLCLFIIASLFNIYKECKKAITNGPMLHLMIKATRMQSNEITSYIQGNIETVNNGNVEV
jgi:hypothetical protein